MCSEVCRGRYSNRSVSAFGGNDISAHCVLPRTFAKQQVVDLRQFIQGLAQIIDDVIRIFNPATQIFGGLGTPINIYDLETGEYRPTTLQDMTDHLILFEHLEHIVSNQMDIWPGDIPMHTIHAEAIRSWAMNCRKSFGMGAYGVMATRDMMEMMMLAAGGRDAIKDRHPFATIVSIQSPMATIQAQLAHAYGIPCRAVAGATEAKTVDIQSVYIRYRQSGNQRGREAARL